MVNARSKISISTSSPSASSSSHDSGTGNADSTSSNPGAASSSATAQAPVLPNDGLLSETPAVSAISELDSDADSSVEGLPSKINTPATTDPNVLSEQLNEMLKRNSVRTAMWHFANAIAAPDSPALNERVARIMMPVLGRNAWGQTSIDVIKICLSREYDLGVGIYNCGLHAISRSGDHDTISSIIDSMWTLPKDSQPNATTYNYLLGAHVYRGGLDGAFDVLNLMKERMIYPTFSTYHSLITGCLRRRDPRRAYATLVAVQKQRFDVSAMTIAQVLVASANNDDFDHVTELLNEFEVALPRYVNELNRIAESRPLYKLNTEVRTSSEDRISLRGEPRLELGALSAVLHAGFRGGRSDIAIRAWALIENLYPQEQIPAPLWYCLIGAFSGSGDLGKAFDTLAIMRERGMQPNFKDLEIALIRPLAFDVAKIDEQFFRLVDRYEGKEVTALDNQVFESEPAMSVVTTQEGEGTNIPSDDESAENAQQDSGSSNEAQMSQATSITESDEGNQSTDMTQSGNMSTVSDSTTTVEGSEDTAVNKLAGSLGEILREQPEPPVSRHIFDNFKPTTVGIDELNCIIAACSAANDLDRAFQTYDEIESRFGLERNIDTFNALLEGCVQTRHLRGGLRVLQEMDNVGLERSSETVHLTCRLFLRSGKVQNALEEIYKAREKGVRVTMQTYHMLIKQCLRNGREQEAIEIVDQLLDDGVPRRLVTGRMDYNTLKQLDQLTGTVKNQPTNENSHDETNMNSDLENNKMDPLADDASTTSDQNETSQVISEHQSDK